MADHRRQDSKKDFWFNAFIREKAAQMAKGADKTIADQAGKLGAIDTLMPLLEKNQFEEFERRHDAFFEEKVDYAFLDTALAHNQMDEPQNTGSENLAGLIEISAKGINTWLSDKSEKDGLFIGSLLSLIASKQELAEKIRDLGVENDSRISNFVKTFSSDVIVVHIPEKIAVDGIIRVQIASDLNQSISPIHIIIHIARSAKGNIVLNLRPDAANHAKGILAIQTQIILEENGVLSLFQHQNAAENVLVLAAQNIRQERDSKAEIFNLDLGGVGTSQEVSVDLVGEGAESVITGIYRPGKNRKYFFDTEQVHSASYTQSDLMYKGVLGKNAFTSWKGNIVVQKATKGTNGYQANNNLIIDESAKVESIPGLEIITDDVKCSHGVTIGNIDKNHMFYLQSRGINKEDAEKLIVNGFLESSLKRMHSEELLNQISQNFGN